jgi:predicted DNA-binding protein
MMETLSIKVPTAQKTRLKALASKRKTTLSSLMLDALERLSRESEAVSPVSCFELSRDLFEKAQNLGASKEGDRSVNKKRLRSFGRSAK